MSLPKSKMAVLTVKTSEGEDRSWMPVRDRRAKNWHWKLNALHDEIFVPESQEVLTFAALLGPAACAVYDYLCRRADEETQTCFPSHPTIAFGTGQSEPTVIEAIAVLCFYGLVWKENREADEGDPTSNLFFLLPVESWTLDGGQWEVSKDHAERMANRRKKLSTRKLPYYLRRRFFPGVRKTVEAVKNFNHPDKEALPPLIKNFGDSGENSLPLLEETSIEPETIESTSTEARQHSAVVEDSSESNEAPSAAINPAPETDVKQQLLEFAAARSVKLSDLDATALIKSWPAAKLRDGELAGALTVDFARYGLDETVGGDEGAKMVRHDTRRLRWFLCVWGAFKESTDDYHEKTGHKWTKTQCFLKKWKVEQPPADWLEKELRALKENAAKADFEREQKEVEAFWATLSNSQKRAMDKDALADLQEKQPGQHFNFHSPELRARRWEMLRDPETQQWLLEMPAETPREQTGVKGELNGAVHDDTGEESPPVQLRFEAIIGAILQDVNAGRIPASRLDTARPALLEDDEWSEVKSQIELRLAA